MTQSKWRHPSPLKSQKNLGLMLSIFVDTPLKLISLMMGVGILITAGFYFFNNLQSQEIPLIKAPIGPFKIRPEKETTALIPHKEKTIYNTLHQEKGSPQHVEQIVTAPEEPMVQTPTLADQFFESFLNSKSPPALSAGQPPSESKTVKIYTFIPNPNQREQSLLKVGYYVEISGFSSREKAEEQWKNLTQDSSFSKFELTKDYQIIRTDLGYSVGVDYRIRLGPVETEHGAKELCYGHPHPCHIFHITP